MGGAPEASPAWFFVEDGKVVGPISADDLAACVRAGRIARETLVAPSGSSAWVSAGQIDGLLTAQRPPSPEAPASPVPPAADLATSEGLEEEDDDVATSDTLGDAVARGTGPRRARSRPRPDAIAGERTPGRRGIIFLVLGGVIVVGVVAALLLRREEPAPPVEEHATGRPAAAPSSIGVAAAQPAAPVASAPVAAAPASSAPAPPVAPAPRSGVVAAEPPAAPVDAVAGPREAAAGEIAKLQASYQAQVASFVSAGGLDPAKLRTPADVDARLQQVAGLRDENLAVERGLLDIAQGLRARLIAQGVPDSEAAALARTAQADLRITPLVQACRLEDDAWAASDDLLGTLRGTLGHWHVRPDGDLEFDDSVSPATYQNYADAIERVKAAAHGQQDLAAR
jgi:hypothetical protein